MSGIDNSRDDEAEEANNKLDEGLKSCRAMVSNYRALLDNKGMKPVINDGETGDPPDEGGDTPAA